MISPKQSFDLFHDIDLSCTDQLQELGIRGEAKVVPGGVEIKFSEFNSSTLGALGSIPVKGFDFREVQLPEISEFSHFPISSLSVPAGSSFKISDLNCFQLRTLNNGLRL